MGNSVTDWLSAFREGNRDAAQLLWARYYERMVRVAQNRLSSEAERMSDGEDVALSAFNAFCAGLESGRFPDIRDRNALWRLLLTITARKAISHHRRATGHKRLPRGQSLVSGEAALEAVLAREPTPEFCAQAADELQYLLRILDDGQLRQIAILRMEGYSVAEIAEAQCCSPSTIERKLRMVRHQWSRLAYGESGP